MTGSPGLLPALFEEPPACRRFMFLDAKNISWSGTFQMRNMECRRRIWNYQNKDKP